MSVATRFWTYTELSEKLDRDLDLEGEVMFQPAEMLGYFNEAVDKAEEIVHSIYEDYFLDKDTITLVPGTSEYVLPSRIYAHKIRRIIYRNGSAVYPVTRIKDWRKFEEYACDLVSGAGGQLRYFIINSSAGSPKILFSPEVTDDGSFITVWFLRQANRFVTGSDVMDVPEAANFIMQYVKCRCYEKEGHPNLPGALGNLTDLKVSLEGVLAAMVPDADNEIEMDLSFYGDMN